MIWQLFYGYMFILNVSGGHVWAEKTSYFRRRFVFALPIFPGSRPPSIVGAHELNFCVRDGNRWTLMTINTNYEFKKDLVTHTGFEPMLTA